MRPRPTEPLLRIVSVVVLAVVAVVVTSLVYHPNFAVLNPKGIMASRERTLIITATLLMLIVVIPVFAATAFIAFKYRASNPKAKYQPDLDHHAGIEITWWAIPGLIIGILGFVAWQSSHALDPFKPLTSNQPTLTVQVVALQWRWLFIYPQQHVASLNWLELPVGQPVSFQVTSDAPMNSFWIPQLSGQIYAMPGMSTALQVMASQPGDYRGWSANISGQGFSDMTFTARAVSAVAFGQWVKQAQSAPSQLTATAYNQLAQPSQDQTTASYRLPIANLYDQIMMKYMMPDAVISNNNAGVYAP